MRRRFGVVYGPVLSWGIPVVAAMLLSLTSGGCTPKTPEDPRWRRPGTEFSALADGFVRTSADLTEKLNGAHTSGNFASISESAPALLVSLSDTVTKMEALVPRVHSNLTAIATEIASAGRAWVEAAGKALAAGLEGDAAAFAEASDMLNRERARINLSIRKWNVAIEAT